MAKEPRRGKREKNTPPAKQRVSHLPSISLSGWKKRKGKKKKRKKEMLVHILGGCHAGPSAYPAEQTSRGGKEKKNPKKRRKKKKTN